MNSPLRCVATIAWFNPVLHELFYDFSVKVHSTGRLIHAVPTNVEEAGHIDVDYYVPTLQWRRWPDVLSVCNQRHSQPGGSAPQVSRRTSRD